MSSDDKLLEYEHFEKMERISWEGLAKVWTRIGVIIVVIVTLMTYCEVADGECNALSESQECKR